MTLVAGMLAALPVAARALPKDRLEDCVDRALAFLQAMQEADGSWLLSSEKSPALTGLAVTAFLSAGHLPGEGPYGPTVEKGIGWVLRAQQPSGLFSAGASATAMYDQGICTLMLCEAAGMTDETRGAEVRAGLEKAVSLILKAQRTEAGPARGGWRYRVDGTDADLSVTGWQLLALRAAKNLGCDVPGERIELALDFLRRCRDPLSGGYCYMPGGKLTIPCTGTAILGQEICGKDGHRTRDVLQAGSFLLKHPPRWGSDHFFYGIYYCAQAMFQLGHNYWNAFRPQFHKVMFDNQKANGSWISPEGLGPVYGTAMAVLALTVEYRYLPIYQRHEEPSDSTLSGKGN